MTRQAQGARAAMATVGGSTAQRELRGPLASALLSGAVDRLLERSDAELVAATFSAEAGERFVHAHLAALRAGAAVVEARAAAPGARTARRSRPRPVWELVAALEPRLTDWTAVFAAAAPLRAAVETGRGEVDEERADAALAAAEAFQDEVRELLAESRGSELTGRALALRAS